jgi:YD repeat-containing protein
VLSRFAVLCSLIVVTHLAAADIDYRINIDGVAAGHCMAKTRATADGIIEIHGRIEIKASKLQPFALSYEGREQWRDRKLQRLDGSGADGGRTGKVTLTAGKDGFALKAGLKEVTVRTDVWPTTFWLLSAADDVLVVDVITGNVLRAKIDKVGAGATTIGDRTTRTVQYRVTTGGQRHDLQYDAANRLVRHAYSRDGHEFVIERTTIKD